MFFISVKLGVDSIKLQQEIKRYYNLKKNTRIRETKLNPIQKLAINVIFDPKEELHYIEEGFYIHLSLNQSSIINSSIEESKLNTFAKDLYTSAIDIARKHNIKFKKD